MRSARRQARQGAVPGAAIEAEGLWLRGDARQFRQFGCARRGWRRRGRDQMHTKHACRAKHRGRWCSRRRSRPGVCAVGDVRRARRLGRRGSRVLLRVLFAPGLLPSTRRRERGLVPSTRRRERGLLPSTRRRERGGGGGGGGVSGGEAGSITGSMADAIEGTQRGRCAA